MAASKANPEYTVYIVAGDTKYNVTPAVTEIAFSDQKGQIAKSAKIEIQNVQVNGSWLTGILDVRDRVYIYANDGEKSAEVWRGFIWTRSYKSLLTDRPFTLTCYDNLIYLQESQESLFFSSGKSTKDILSTICKEWGIKLEYSYKSITHSKLALRGNLSDIITADILDKVKKQTGAKYVIISEKDTMYVKSVGTNAEVYPITEGNNAIGTTSETTMAGMTTKVVILGKADKDDRLPVEATVSGKTEQYGTMQKIETRSENTTLADAKKEAQETIDENGTPKKECELGAPDIPWIRKGDKVYVSAGDLVGGFIVMGISRTISIKEKTMTLTLEKAS